jgi:regulator of sigma D
MSSGIKYYSDLVDEMVDDHRVLLAAYGDLVKAANTNDASGFKFLLLKFKSLLVAHLLKEAVKLYIYLRQKLKVDDSAYSLVTSYKSEMDGISRVAMAFVDEYTEKPVHQIDFHQLTQQLREIGLVLGNRIRREESELYPLYHDHY